MTDYTFKTHTTYKFSCLSFVLFCSYQVLVHKEQIKQCLPISVEVINAAMGILQSTEVSKSTGFQKIEGNCNFRGDGSPFIQIVPLTALTETWVHWGTLSNIFSPNGHVTLYDCARRLHYRSATREIRYGLVIE